MPTFKSVFKMPFSSHPQASACLLRIQRKSDRVALLSLQWNFYSEHSLLMACSQIAFPSGAEKSIASVESTDAGESAKVTILDVGSCCCAEEVCQFT